MTEIGGASVDRQMLEVEEAQRQAETDVPWASSQPDGDPGDQVELPRSRHPPAAAAGKPPRAGDPAEDAPVEAAPENEA